ncbi:MAG: DUF3341 domain-containing protein [bacterium]|nr:DUF3341 domain-containing protein [bacterium]
MSKEYLIAVFGDENDIIDATKKARELDLTIVDVYVPYHVHGLDKTLGLKPSRLPWVSFVLGFAGAALFFWFQLWTSAVNWAINVGGKPWDSVPAFVPAKFEMMVLFGGIGTVLAFFIGSRLFPGKKTKPVVEGVTDDKFALLIEETDAYFDVKKAEEVFAPFKVIEITERLINTGGK